MKKVCEECGSDDVTYYCTARFDPNDNYRYIEMCEWSGDDSWDWCNNCDKHTILEERIN